MNLCSIGSDYGPIPEELWQFFVNTYGGGPEVILHSYQRPVPAHSSIPAHSATSPNLVDPNPKFNRVEAKPKQMTAAKSTESISMQDSSAPAENNSTVISEAHQSPRETNS